MAKRAKESSRTGRPAMIMITPITRNPEKPNNAGAKCQRVVRHGTYTASVPGAMTRKMADPMMAAGRSIKVRQQATGNRLQVAEKDQKQNLRPRCKKKESRLQGREKQNKRTPKEHSTAEYAEAAG